MQKHNFQIILFSLLSMASPKVKAIYFPANYQLTYEVSRGGKAMAKQTTTFKTHTINKHTLTDVTKGTRGLASFTGFKRTETTHFEFQHKQLIAVEHNMQQKIAFKSKSYHFKLLPNNNTIKGKSKQDFTLETTIKPISPHMLPLWLRHRVCHNPKPQVTHISVPVLKSKRIKTYDFTVIDENAQFFRIERVYPDNSQRSS